MVAKYMVSPSTKLNLFLANNSYKFDECIIQTPRADSPSGYQSCARLHLKSQTQEKQWQRDLSQWSQDGVECYIRYVLYVHVHVHVRGYLRTPV